MNKKTYFPRFAMDRRNILGVFRQPVVQVLTEFRNQIQVLRKKRSNFKIQTDFSAEWQHWVL